VAEKNMKSKSDYQMGERKMNAEEKKENYYWGLNQSVILLFNC